MKMMAIRLLTTCIIAGLPRSPVEGIQTVPEPEGKRLIDLKMAEAAEGDVEREDADPGDGLEAKGMTEKKLRELAGAEGATVEGDADKPTIIAAIRARRALFADTGIDPVSDDQLRKEAADEGYTVADGADTGALILAIASGRKAKAEAAPTQ
jgi:hypothetical protein